MHDASSVHLNKPGAGIVPISEKFHFHKGNDLMRTLNAASDAFNCQCSYHEERNYDNKHGTLKSTAALHDDVTQMQSSIKL